MKFLLLFLFTFLYFSDHLITVYSITNKGIQFELNPIIRTLWIKWGITGFVIASLLVWASFVLVYYLAWDTIWIGFKIIFYFVIFNFLLTNLNHIFHFI